MGIQFDFDYEEPEKLKRWTLDSYALVLTLVQLPPEISGENIVSITPFLTDDNRQQIYGVLRRNRIISRYATLIDGIIKIVSNGLPEHDATILESDKLHFELFRYFDERDRGLMGPPVIQSQSSCVLSDAVVVPEGSTWK